MARDLPGSVKFQFKIEIAPPAGEMREVPTIEQIRLALEDGLRTAFSDWAEVKAYDGERSDI